MDKKHKGQEEQSNHIGQAQQEREASADNSGRIKKYLDFADRFFGGGKPFGDDDPTPNAA